MSNVYDRKKLYKVIIAQLIHMHYTVGECKCPDKRKWLQASSEYSRRRVQSPLVDLTAWHKKSALVIGPPHQTRLTVTGV